MNSPSSRASFSEPFLQLLQETISRPEVSSVSFPYDDETVWRQLVAEQVKRMNGSSAHPLQVFALIGPDHPLPFNPAHWGGRVHIPYEGVAGADVLIKAPWQVFDPGSIEGDKNAHLGNVVRKACNFLFVPGRRPPLEVATATRIDGWTLYTANSSLGRCDPFGKLGFMSGFSLPEVLAPTWRMH